MNNDMANYFDLFGERTAFLCYVLRYWLKLCTNQMDGFNEGHFLAAAILLLGDLDPREFQRISVRPTPQCLTLYAWLEVLTSMSTMFIGCNAYDLKCMYHHADLLMI